VQLGIHKVVVLVVIPLAPNVGSGAELDIHHR
jgi:hypothetical protein